MINVKVIKPSLPIIFIDTFFFIDLVSGRHKNPKPHYLKEEEELIDLVHKLTSEGKILCPQGDQEEEYELGIRYEDEIRKEQAQLSRGVRSMYHYGTYKYQVQIAMAAYMANKKIVTYDSKSIFDRNTVEELKRSQQNHYIISVHIPMPNEYLDKKRRTKKELAQDFESLRQENIKNGVKFKDQVRRETLGKLDAIVNTLKTAIPKLAANQPLTEQESNGMQVLGDYLAYYSHYSGKDADIKEVADFIKSEHYATVPYISTQSRLYASLLTQENRVKETDNFDINQTSQMLPFSTYFLTDSSLKHRITSGPLRLDKEYGVKIYAIKEVKELITELKQL